MGLVASYLEQRLASDLNDRGVLVWYDLAGEWMPWVREKLGGDGMSGAAETHRVSIGEEEDVHVIPFTGSYYEVVEVCEALLLEDPSSKVLIYVGGQLPPEELSPLRELECLGGERERYRHDLRRVARSAFEAAGLADSKIDEFLGDEDISLPFLDAVRVDSGGDASPLQPIFGTSREEEVLPRFLGDEQKWLEVTRAGRLYDVARLVERGLGTSLKEWACAGGSGEEAAAEAAKQIARVLLIAEMRSDLQGQEPKEISQVPAPSPASHAERAREICHRLRRLYPDSYEQIADDVETALGLASADIDALSLGHIDTFRFEERRLLAACDALLAEGEARKALDVAEARADSFWTSVARFPERHAAWSACGALARLCIAIEQARAELAQAPKDASAWVQRYAAPEGWHRVDRLFREARYRLTRLSDQGELRRAADAVFARYDALAGPMAEQFLKAYRESGWELRNVPSQTSVYQRFVSKRQRPVAYFHVDAMRFEMAAELAELAEAVGAEDVQLQPAAAVAPTITDLGMVALLPGADRSFSMVGHDKGIAGSIQGKPLIGVASRMDFAKAEVPGLVEMTLDRLLFELDAKGIQKAVRDAPVIIIRSQEIDGAGENLPDNLARTIMGSVLENVRQGILRLAEAGIKEFVITADHGHLYGARRGDDMKIDAPSGGEEADLHRRCWVGRGGDTPSPCVRLSASDLGYSDTDMDLVVPKGLGVFKAGGSLSFHHGGLSLQEVVIPVLGFHLERGGQKDAKRSGDIVALESVPERITNMIFSLKVRRIDLPMEPLHLRLIVETAGEEERRIVGQAVFANVGWNHERQTLALEGAEPASVGIQIDDENTSEVRVLVVQVDTDRTLKDTGPIPVNITK